MTTYIVSYDLVKTRDYESLYKAIKALGTTAKVLESLWVVITPYSAKQIRDHLLNYVDGDDRLFILKSGGEGAWRNSLCNNQWLVENL